MMRCLLLLLLFTTAVSAGKKTDPAYQILSKIRSPHELVFPLFPGQYCAPVRLSGSIADEMQRAIADQGMNAPIYCESFDGKKFSLLLANPEYAIQTRDLLSGIVNPAEMIELVTGAIVKYRRESELLALLNETDVAIDEQADVTLLSFRPKGDRFSHTYKDMGALVQESWLSGMELTIQNNSWLVTRLSLRKHSRNFDPSTGTPATDSMRIVYSVSYSTIENKLIPENLDLQIDGRNVMTIQAHYRKENNKVVFDTKEICVYQNEIRSCLRMDFLKYEKIACRFDQDTKGKTYGRKLVKAAELSRKAAELLREGNISPAVSVLKTLMVKYPGTPQAVEAEKILCRVPQNLQ